MDEALEKHGVRWRFRGLPIYDDGDEEIGVTTEDEWTWADLSADQRGIVERDVTDVQEVAGITRDQAMPLVLHHYGITCPHNWRNEGVYFRECQWCHIVEVPPGRVVEVGGELMRVPDPPPPTLRIPVPRPAATAMMAAPVGPHDDIGPLITEYRWDGRRYQLASR